MAFQKGGKKAQVFYIYPTLKCPLMQQARQLTTTILFVLNSLHANAQNFNRPVPAEVSPYEFIQYDTTFHGFYLTAPFPLGAAIADSLVNKPKTAMILDAQGYLLWYAPLFSQNLLDFKYHPAQQQYSWIHYKSAEDIRFTLLDANLQLTDSFTTVNGILPDLHEFRITSDQTYLLSGISDSIMDLSAYSFNGVPGSSQTHAIGFVVQEFDEAHQLLFQWNSNDHVHPTEAYENYGYSPAGFDYAHGNAITEHPDGSLLLSFRNTNAIYKVNRQNGQVEWILGGKSSSFTFPNDPGFSAQHDVQILPNGNITLFDNANMAAPPKISRAVEYSLDTMNWTANRVWEYKYTPGFLSPAMGNHQTTADRFHLINYGLNYRPNPSFVLTDDEGNLLSQLFFQDSLVSYRSFIFELPMQQIARPVVSCNQENGVLTLSAPAGYNRYEWSTGESGAAISIDQPGEYQVWVNYGAGMLGSAPFVVSDLANACQSSGTASPLLIENKTVTGYYDVLGRQIERPVKGNLYVIRYSNGTAKMNFCTE